VVVMSEAEKSFRAWTRERETKIAPLLRQIENGSQRIAGIEMERQHLSTEIEGWMKQLVELGVSPEQIEGFVGDVHPPVVVHRVARPRKPAPKTALAATVNGTSPPAEVAGS
jgi:hypothetical protein